MRVKTRELTEGCRLSADVMGLVTQPLISKNSVITDRHIEVLKAFLISEVEVESILYKEIPSTDEGPSKENKILETFTPLEAYFQAVQEYKQLFQQWQSGVLLDMMSVRRIFVPLLNDFLKIPASIFRLHDKVDSEDYLFHHAITVGLLSGYLAKRSRYEAGECIQIGLGGVLADCGMSKISPFLLQKNKELTYKEEEWIKRHPINSYEMLKNIPSIQEGVLFTVLQHHERNDGSGYPLGIKRDKIHPFSLIIAVCDIYHAMVSKRVYRHPQSPISVLNELISDYFQKLDHQTLRHLQEGIMQSIVGQTVLLSNQKQAEVIFVNPSQITRPIVRLEDGTIISLGHNNTLHIIE